MDTIGYSKICGVGAYTPKQIISSVALMDEVKSESFGVPNTFISNKVGIIERRISRQDESISGLAIESAQIAMNNASISAKDIDMVIFCGIERDYCEPATAHFIAGTLDINARCFDVSNACHGFMDGISIADTMIGAGSIENALIVTGEKSSEVLQATINLIKKCNNANDFKRYVGGLTVGDAGGAIVLSKATNGAGFKKFHFASESDKADLCYYKYHPNGKFEGQMLMKQISGAILNLHESLIQKTYEILNWKPQQIDSLICHQVGLIPHRLMARLAGISFEKAATTITHYGNCTSATLPLNLYLFPPKKGDKVLLMSTGSGLSIGQTGLIY